MKISIRLAAIILFLASTAVSAAPPRWHRGGRFQNRRPNFPVIVDYDARRSGFRGGNITRLPSGSASYTSIPAVWPHTPTWAPIRHPDPATLPPGAAPFHAPGYSQGVVPGIFPPGTRQGSQTPEVTPVHPEHQTPTPPTQSAPVPASPNNRSSTASPVDPADSKSELRKLHL